MNPNDQLDHLIDRALSEYRDAEPLAGMEDRILRRIAGQPERVSGRWAWMLAMVAAVAVIVAAVCLGLRERPPGQRVATNVSQPAKQPAISASQVETPNSQSIPPQSATPAKAASRGRSSTIAPQVARVSSKSAPNQFPTPAPMSADERTLLALARTHPDALLVRSDDADELSIAPIEIKPLAPESGAPQGEQQ
jgi:hypothetical protein